MRMVGNIPNPPGTDPLAKMAWIRRNAAELGLGDGEALPDFYALRAAAFVPNGCGPTGWRWLSRLIPDQLPGLPNWSVAGDLHDWLYWRGGGEVERKQADLALLKGMRLLARGQNRFVRWRLWWLSLWYWSAVRWKGGEHFNYWGQYHG